MAKLIWLWMVLIPSFTAGQNGVQFHGSFNESVLDKNSEKLVFVDVYTSWCGPCKKMDEEVFTDHELGLFMASFFEAYKLDGDSSKGKNWGEKWNIKVYPSLAFLNQNGELIQLVEGYKNQFQLMELGDAVMAFAKYLKVNPTALSLDELQEWLLNTIALQSSDKLPFLHEYLRRKGGLDTSDFVMVELIRSSARIVDGPSLEYGLKICKNHDMDKKMANELSNQMDELISSAVENGNRESLTNYLSLKSKLLTEKQFPPLKVSRFKADSLSALYQFTKRHTENETQIFDLANQQFELLTLGKNIAYINRLDGFLNMEITPGNPRSRATTIKQLILEIGYDAYTWYQHSDRLEVALRWIEYGLSIEENAEILLMKAGILHRLYQPEKAKKVLLRAAELPNFIIKKSRYPELF